MIKKQKQIPDFFIYTILTSILIILCMPFLLTRNGLECLDFRETGQIGDTIGGITAPFIGLINVILLCYTLYCQNQSHKEQTELAANEQFKSALFSLLTTQREIMQQVGSKFPYINPHDIRSRKYSEEQISYSFFKSAIVHLDYVFFSLQHQLIEVDDEVLNDVEDDIEKEAYERGINGFNVPQEEGTAFREYCREKRIPFIANYYNHEYMVTAEWINKYNQEESVQNKIIIAAKHFFAKHSSVSSYYTHLYHLLKFIENNENEAIKRNGQNKSEIKKLYRDYAQLVQAQMSREEQILLFYNSFLSTEMQKLIIHYGILNNLSVKDLIQETHNCIKAYGLQKERMYDLISDKQEL